MAHWARVCILLLTVLHTGCTRVAESTLVAYTDVFVFVRMVTPRWHLHRGVITCPACMIMGRPDVDWWPLIPQSLFVHAFCRAGVLLRSPPLEVLIALLPLGATVGAVQQMLVSFGLLCPA